MPSWSNNISPTNHHRRATGDDHAPVGGAVTHSGKLKSNAALRQPYRAVEAEVAFAVFRLGEKRLHRAE